MKNQRRGRRRASPRVSRRAAAAKPTQQAPAKPKNEPKGPQPFTLKDRDGNEHRYTWDFFPAAVGFDLSAELASLFGKELAQIMGKGRAFKAGLRDLMLEPPFEPEEEEEEDEENDGAESADYDLDEDDEAFEAEEQSFDESEAEKRGVDLIVELAPDVTEIGRKLLGAGGFELAYVILSHTRRDKKSIGNEAGFQMAYTGNTAEAYRALFEIIRRNFSDFFGIISR